MIDELQRRLDGAPPGATLRLPAGHYRGGWAIRRDVTLVGEGAGRTTLAGGPEGPVLRLRPGARLRLERLSLVGGRVPAGRGGALNVVDSELTVIDCELRDNRAVVGGALCFKGAALGHIERCRFRGNAAVKLGGGLAVTGASKVSIRRVSFEANTALDGGHHLVGMRRPGATPSVRLEAVAFAPVAGRGTSIANVRGFEARFTLIDCAWPPDSLKVPQR